MNVHQPLAILLAVLALAAPAAADSTAPEIWTMDAGPVRDFQLWPNGKVVALGNGRNPDPRGIRGFWHRSGASATILLETGATIILETPAGAPATARAAGSGKSPVRAQKLPASPVDGAAADWIGVWIWDGPHGRRYVALRSDRAVFSDSAAHGVWVPAIRGIRVEWNDGAIDLLQFEPDGPALKSWAAGVPTRSAAPLISAPRRVGEFEIAP